VPQSRRTKFSLVAVDEAVVRVAVRLFCDTNPPFRCCLFGKTQLGVSLAWLETGCGYLWARSR
jgi:hypothetical protein